MKKILILLLCVLATPLLAATTANDDSCDIAVQPAATLLLPYFEVDFRGPQTTAVQTLFTIQNVSRQPQIAQVTLWTDRGYPVLDWPVFLTGYDVQAFNLYDIFARGIIAPGSTPGGGGTSSNTPVPTNPTTGSQPAANTGNPNFLADTPTACASLPGVFSSSLLTDLQSIFTTGTSTGTLISCSSPPPPAGALGNVHPHAIGYITVDVVATCAGSVPGSTAYFNTLLFDNTLTGDYQILVPRADKSYAQGGPLVHIRAIPEGGPSGANPGSTLPYTFYGRFMGAAQPKFDRRQPLPAVFAPRYIQGGTGGFNTTLRIWREPTTGLNATCAAYAANSSIPVADIVRFDEHENATILSGTSSTPAATQLPTSDTFFPPMTASTDVAGWIYLNLNGNAAGSRASQAWVTTSMFAEPTYAVEATAVALGNGCSAPVAPNAQIGPLP